MADRLGLDSTVKELRLGETFNKSYKDGAFHTIRYDFKPASVDKGKMGTVDVESNHQVTLTVPHVEGAPTNQTVFQGNHMPVAKECVLIIDHNTGEIVLERISQAIKVKTTRPEGSSRIPTQRPPTPLDPPRKKSPQQKCSPSHSRGNHRPSPSHVKLSPTNTKLSPHPRSPIPSKSPSNSHAAEGSMPFLSMPSMDSTAETHKQEVISDSSSDSDSNSSSSSSSDSDSDSEPDQDTRGKKTNGHGTAAAAAAAAAAAGAGAAGGPTNNGSSLASDLELSSVSEDSD